MTTDILIARGDTADIPVEVILSGTRTRDEYGAPCTEWEVELAKVTETTEGYAKGTVVELTNDEIERAVENLQAARA